jgi:hypothetical protein
MNGGLTHSEISARGGKSRSQAKLKAARANVLKAQKARAEKAKAAGRSLRTFTS